MIVAMAASIQERPGGAQQLRVTHRLLPKPFFWTFKGADAKAQAEDYRDKLQSLLSRGIVPQEMLAAPAKGEDPLIAEIISQYERSATPTDSDLALLKLIRVETPGLRASALTYAWVEDWVRRLKLEANLAPGSIRKRVGCLARVYDWHLKRVTAKGSAMPANPLRLLPRGYSQYTAADAEHVDEVKFDETRDRRLAPEEESRIRLALAGVKRVDRERPLQVDEELTLLFDLILDTGLRLREAYTLVPSQIDVEKGFINVQGTKASRGQRKPRTVPLKKHLRPRLREWCKGKRSRVFQSLWDGDTDKKALARTTARLSVRFMTLFRYAEVHDFTEHDLRHEATCRWFLLRDARGAWVFSEIEICRIMGWTNTKMALRYASLRGEDLADRLL